MTITDSFREMPLFRFPLRDGTGHRWLQRSQAWAARQRVLRQRQRGGATQQESRDRLDPARRRPRPSQQRAETMDSSVPRELHTPADSYARTAKVWIQYPPFHGKFFAVIEIDFPENESLAAIHTKSFTGRETQPRERSGPAAVTRTITTVTTIPAITTVATTVDGTITTDTATIPTTSTPQSRPPFRRRRPQSPGQQRRRCRPFRRMCQSCARKPRSSRRDLSALSRNPNKPQWSAARLSSQNVLDQFIASLTSDHLSYT